MSKPKTKIKYTGHALKRWIDRVGNSEEEFRAQLDSLAFQIRPSKSSPLRKCNKSQYASAKFYNFTYKGKLVSIPVEMKNGKLTAVTVLT